LGLQPFAQKEINQSIFRMSPTPRKTCPRFDPAEAEKKLLESLSSYSNIPKKGKRNDRGTSGKEASIRNGKREHRDVKGRLGPYK